MGEVWENSAATAAVILFAVFAASGLLKLRSFALFREHLADFELVPRGAVTVAAGGVVLAELVVAALVAARASIGAWVAAGTLVAFATVVAITWLRGKRDLACACFGQSRDAPIGWHVVLRDLGLAGLAVPASRLDGLPRATGVLAGSLLVLLYLLAVELASETARLREALRRSPLAANSPTEVRT